MKTMHPVHEWLDEMYEAPAERVELGLLPLEGPLTVWDFLFERSARLPLRGPLTTTAFVVDGEIAAYTLGVVDERSTLTEVQAPEGDSTTTLELGCTAGRGRFRDWFSLSRTEDEDAVVDDCLSADIDSLALDEYVTKAPFEHLPPLLLLAGPPHMPVECEKVVVEVLFARNDDNVITGALLLFVWM